MSDRQQSAEPGRDRDETTAATMIERASDLAGALAGGGLTLAGGPVAVLGGAALGVVFKHAVVAVASRLHGRAAERAGAAAILIEDRARQSKARLRDDGFFDPDGQHRPPAEELLEGVLMKAAEAYEERKVPLLANFYAGVAERSEVSPGDANRLLRIAERLSFRQLVALAVFGDDRYFRRLARASTTRAEGQTCVSASLEGEIEELAEVGLLGVRVEGKGPFRVGEVYGSQAPISQKELGTLKLLPLGRLLHDLMQLELVDDRERDRLLGELAQPRYNDN